ncbi:MAG: methyltransferase domain-containing protein, partial [Deltaproteobacteria bacterium]|nr:methyltransferase domain-containing protein [Deltaproteobacteria bacterium]
MQGFWNRLKARWYRKGLDYSGFADAALSVILPRAGNAKTFLDVGAGCGSLSVPLAKAGKKVTALDPAVAMIEILKEDVEREGLGKRITPILSGWDAARVKQHDVVLCANVPELLKKPGGFLKEADAAAKKMVFIIVNADPKADKFYYRELYPLLFKKEFVKEG